MPCTDFKSDGAHRKMGAVGSIPSRLRHSFRSLEELIDFASGKELLKGMVDQMGDAGIAELLPFPFLAIVGQNGMKLALMLGLINPNVGGILLIGIGVSNLLEIKKIRVGNMLPALFIAPLIVWVLSLF